MTETELRWQLRQLPRELEPSRDLWPGIAGNLGRPVPRRRPWLAALALAACLVLALGLGLGLRLRLSSTGPSAELDTRRELVQREAEGLTLEYQAALSQFEGAPIPEPLVPALATLDQSAADIRSALDADPGAVFLLEQLRRTYARRLSLTQRAVIG